MNTTTLIYSIRQNWSLPPGSSLTCILPSSLLGDISITSLPPPLLAAIHTLSALTPGQRGRAHSLLNTYFQARIREGSYNGKHRSMVAILEVCDVDKACDSARRMSRGREMQGLVPVRIKGGRYCGQGGRGWTEDEEEHVDQVFPDALLERQYLDMDMQDEGISTRDCAFVAPPFGAALDEGVQEGNLQDQKGGHGHEEGVDDATLPPLTPHTEKRRVHVPPIRTSHINTPTAASPHALQSSFTPLFESLKMEMESDIGLEHDQQQSPPPPPPPPPQLHQHQQPSLQHQRLHHLEHPIILGPNHASDNRSNTATDRRLLAAQQRATHEFNLCRLHLQEKMKQFERARWRCEGARQRMEGLRGKARAKGIW